MFSRIGPMELVVILAIVLVIFGPRNLPEIGKSMGKAIQNFKQGMREVEQNITEDGKDEKMFKQDK